jgi:mono/diheme cytochrome c family protein
LLLGIGDVMRGSQIALLLLMTATSAEGQPHGDHSRGMRHGGASMVRHHFVRQHGIAEEYAGKTSPLAPTPADLTAGRDLYESHCASCHGSGGAGDGVAGAGLDPPPANLAVAVRRPLATDAYLYWTIVEGGASVGSAMPPFDAVLGETEIWQIVAHLRAL